MSLKIAVKGVIEKMNKKIVFGLLIFSNLIFGNEISQSSVATADSKSKACQKALL